MRRWTGESVGDGRYAIEALIGRGRTARVYRGYDRVLLRPVAVKFLPDARWRAEASALDRVDHRHVLRLLDGGAAGDHRFLVLPLMAESLAARLRRGALDGAGAAGVVAALADALGHLHRAGLAHGGIDAAAVLLDDGGRPRWGGLRAGGPAAGEAHDADTDALARLAVRCVTGRAVRGAVPADVLDAIRSAAAHGQDVPGVRLRLAAALETATSARRPTPPRATQPRATPPRATQPRATQPRATQPRATLPRLADVRPFPVPAGLRVRSGPALALRSRPGVAAVLAAGFAASLVGALVMHGSRPADGPDEPIAAFPGTSEPVAAAGGAPDRVGVLAGSAVPDPAAAVRAASVPAVVVEPDAPPAPRVTLVSVTDRPVQRPVRAPRTHDEHAGDDRPRKDRDRDEGDDRPESGDGVRGLVGRVLSVLG